MKDQDIYSSNAILYSASVSLTFFWILNIFKESYKAVKAFLNFYPPIGPLLGLFIFSILVFILVFLLFRSFRIKDQRKSYWAVVIFSLLFSLMVFPPIYEPIVELLAR